MSLELIIRPEAEADALEAFRWYDEQLPGLGQEFLAEIDRALESIQAYPEANRKLYREYRRSLIRRFPYSWLTRRRLSCSGYCMLPEIHVNGGNVGRMPSNNTLERTVNHRGRIVLAMDCVLADAQWALVHGRSTSR